MHWITFLCVARTKLDQEVKEREEKYSELDSKFNRLHKRAKQRIQEVQKVNFCYILFFFLFFYAVKVSLPPRKKIKIVQCSHISSLCYSYLLVLQPIKTIYSLEALHWIILYVFMVT